MNKAPGSKIIHLATHGYFMEGACQPDVPSSGLNSDISFLDENPPFFTGFFFARANLHEQGSDSAGTEEGILTVYKVSAMDLKEMRMVVL